MSQSVKGSLSGGVRDLREKLSGTIQSQAVNKNSLKPKVVPEASKPARKTAVVEASVPEIKKVANPSSKRKQQKAFISLFSFL